MSEITKFYEEVQSNIEEMRKDHALSDLSRKWMRESAQHKYTYNFSWMGRPIIQFPQDLIAMQEIMWRVKPDLIIETGIAHGGSLVFYASMLEMMGGNGHVLGVDIEIRPHNRVEIENHPMARRITMVEGSSIDPNTVAEVVRLAAGKKRILVALDSNHTHDHVLQELKLYSPFVRAGSYLVVFDTIVEDLPECIAADRPWSKGNNPKTAVHAFLETNQRFIVDDELEAKLLISVAPNGFLKCIED
jgi:cephalosporin hydroxylase